MSILLNDFLSIQKVDELIEYSKKEMSYYKNVIIPNINLYRRIVIMLSISVVFLLSALWISKFSLLLSLFAIASCISTIPFWHKFQVDTKLLQSTLYERRINLLNDYVTKNAISIGQLKYINKVILEKKHYILSSNNISRFVTIMCALIIPIWYKYIDYYFNKYILSGKSFFGDSNMKFLVVLLILFFTCVFIYMLFRISFTKIKQYFISNEYIVSLIEDLIYYMEK